LDDAEPIDANIIGTTVVYFNRCSSMVPRIVGLGRNRMRRLRPHRKAITGRVPVCSSALKNLSHPITFLPFPAQKSRQVCVFPYAKAE
jgi:hypothetical protein